jgi:hypothetical protein
MTYSNKGGWTVVDKIAFQRGFKIMSPGSSQEVDISFLSPAFNAF